MSAGDNQDREADDLEQTEEKSKRNKKAKLPAPWDSVQPVIWLLGLALLYWMDWWWPGILVLSAVSVVTQAGLERYFAQRQTSAAAEAAVFAGGDPQLAGLDGRQATTQMALDQQRSAWLPAVCPQCGAPLDVQAIRWSQPDVGNCPYCNALLRPAPR